MTEPPTNRNNSGPATDGRGPAADGRGEGPITRAAVLNAALEIVDRDGVDGLSMRRLAEAVGRDPMVIYRHVSNKAAVLDGVAEIVFAQLSVDAADPDWTTQFPLLRELAPVRAAYDGAAELERGLDIPAHRLGHHTDRPRRRLTGFCTR